MAAKAKEYTDRIGIDIGNGQVKMVREPGKALIMPSYYLRTTDSATERPSSGGYVRYVGGTRKDLEGQDWFSGEYAYQVSPARISSVNQSATAKIDLGLQLILGALSYTPDLADDPVIRIVCSIPHLAYSEELKKAVEGKHKVLFNSSDKVRTVTLKICRIVPEGFGAVVDQDLMEGLNIIIDSGNGTTISSRYGVNGRRLGGGKVVQTGVQSLISDISRDSELIKEIKREGQVHIIRSMLEKSETQYGRTRFDMKDIIVRHMTAWANDTLRQAVDPIRDDMDSADRLLLIGGGAMIPEIASLFMDFGFEVVPGPVLCSARGMQFLAQNLPED